MGLFGKSKDEKAEDQFIKGNYLKLCQKYDEAIECYEKAIKLKPQNADYWLGKADTLSAMGQVLAPYWGAKDCYEKAIELSPEDPYIWNNFGSFLFQPRWYDESISCFNQAIRFKPEMPEAWINKGRALCYQGNFDESIPCFDAAISADSGYSEAWEGKGNALKELGR